MAMDNVEEKSKSERRQLRFNRIESRRGEMPSDEVLDKILTRHEKWLVSSGGAGSYRGCTSAGC